jgi:zinc D-Ala-D-Ala carboxypeptidase
MSGNEQTSESSTRTLIKDWVFTEGEKNTILSLVAKGQAEQKRNDKFDIIDFDSFFGLFSDDERAIVDKYMAIKPEDVGCKLPYLGIEDTPDDLIPIQGQAIVVDGQQQALPCKYLPKTTYEAFLEMDKAIHEQTGGNLLVSHGYRSPARQIFYFFDSLVRRSNFDFQKAVKRIFFPAYSEHVFPKKQAIDFVTKEGIKGEGFEKTKEYRWLKEHAGDFNFVESYPLNNSFGVMYEPWHWHHELKKH